MTNHLIVYPLIIIACIAGFYQLFTISTINFTSKQEIPEMSNSNNDATAFNIEMTTGVVALIISCTIVAVLAGIRLFSSGLSETSVKIIYNSTIYYGLWGIFSALSYPFFLAFPLFLGTFAWFLMTLIYSLGFFESTWRTM